MPDNAWVAGEHGRVAAVPDLDLMLRVSRDPSVISFALGLPAPELFPRQALCQAAAEVGRGSADVFQYASPVRALKRQVVELMSQRGINCGESQVVLTTGAQQALHLLATALLGSRGSVAVEELTYPGFLRAIEPMSPTVISVNSDPRSGVDPDQLAETIGDRRPAFYYTVPEGHNPLGYSLAPDRRERLVEVARRIGMYIVEDDTYGFLQYNDRSMPALRAMADDVVLYVGTFSKIVAPSFRVGWLVVPESVADRVRALKAASDLDGATFGQHVLSAFLSSGALDEHVHELRQSYQSRRNEMLTQMEESFPDDAAWTVPCAGFYIWAEIGRGIDTASLLKRAIGRGVAYLPGMACSTGRCHKSAACAIRLSFSSVTEDSIRLGIASLGSLLRTYTRRS